jgi:O-acetyl-ADP-ribose deacetylase (regulator of RNase III)
MGIRYIERGDIFQDAAQVLVCPTNASGVMGNGLAYAFRMRIPRLFDRYRRHCKTHDPDEMFPYIFNAKYCIVYCLHTKKKWWMDSSTAIVRDGLLKLIDWCARNNIESVAMPALGCGKGGLDFDKDLKPLVEELLKESSMDVAVYCPDYCS